MAKAVLIMDMPECCADCQLADDDPSGLYCPPADDYYDGSDSSEDRASFLPAQGTAREISSSRALRQWKVRCRLERMLRCYRGRCTWERAERVS